jgi:hypothetical protein
MFNGGLQSQGIVQRQKVKRVLAISIISNWAFP